MESANTVRIDKYLWAVRLFKTRTIASEACKAGRITISDYHVKPSREVKVGELFSMKDNPIVRSYRIVAILENRVAAKLVSQFLEEITPASELKKLEDMKQNTVSRDRGTGRPTKKERRDIDEYFDW